MNPVFSQVIEEYRRLEEEVRSAVIDYCRPICSRCRRTCCREEICRETEQSAWLRLTRSSLNPEGASENPNDTSEPAPKQNSVNDENDYDCRVGWMTELGCALATGRPPVCYEFFCEELLAPLDNERRNALMEIGRAMNIAGRQALGPRHLIELNEGQLSSANPAKIMKQIEKAKNALMKSKQTFSTIS